MQVSGNRLPGPGGNFFQRERSHPIGHRILLPAHGAGDNISIGKIRVAGLHNNTLPRTSHERPNLHPVSRDPTRSNRHPKWRSHDEVAHAAAPVALFREAASKAFAAPAPDSDLADDDDAAGLQESALEVEGDEASIESAAARLRLVLAVSADVESDLRKKLPVGMRIRL